MAHRYPPARKGTQVSLFHGVRVDDPYAWLENARDNETVAWVAAQNRLAREMLDRLDHRARIAAALDAMPERASVRLPLPCNDIRIEIVRAESGGVELAAEGSGASLLAVHALSPDVVHEGFVYPSPCGRYIALGVGAQGSDWLKLRIFDRSHGVFCAEVLPEGAHPVVAWTPDGRSFYYNRTVQRFRGGPGVDGVYHHVVGDDPTRDKLVFEHTRPDSHAALPLLLRDGALLIIKTLDFTTQNATLHAHLVGQGTTQTIFEAGAPVNVIGDDGERLYLETNQGAENGRIVALDPLVASPKATELVGELDNPIELASHTVQSPRACCVEGRIFVTYGDAGTHQLRVFSREGVSLGAVEFSGFVTVNEVRAAGALVEAAVESYTVPFARWTIEPQTLAASCEFQTAVPDWVARTRVERHIVECDGVNVPFYVIGDPSRAGAAPTLLYGYGGWGSSVTPTFRPDLSAWLALGGTYAVANVRGGGEFGAAWHRAGAGRNRGVAIDDFCAVARALIDLGVAADGALAARGLSNGGLLVAAAANRAPARFAAIAAEVPLLDVVHLKRLPLGATMVGEFGDPEIDAPTFAAIAGYSPLQNLAPPAAVFPAAFIAPADRDERVPPGQAFKYVAALQARDDRPALMRLVEGEGHVGWRWTSTRAVLIDELAFLWSACAGELAAVMGEPADAMA